MDLLDFDQPSLYYDEPLPEGVDGLIVEAGRCYGEEGAEASLLRAYFLAPEALVVLVALYRYYFYQHRLEDALIVADRAMALVARRLELPADWRRINLDHVGSAVLRSMGLLRFYLHVLKAAGYINLRLERIQTGRAMLEKLTELDTHDRMGAKVLLDVVTQAVASRLEEAA